MLTLRETALALNGALTGDADLVFGRVSTDSRDIKPGDLYVALKGERFDGHDYAAAALAQGAVAVLVEREVPGTSIVVPDALAALGQLGAFWRNRMTDLKVIAVTGSNGKTTVKEMIATVLAHYAGADAVLATRGNLNNHIGVPLTLLSLKPEHRYAVVEMGMNHFGEIDYLTHLASPDVALVNNALRAHLEALGSVEGVARAKGEIFGGLKDRGTAVINADDPHAELWSQLAMGKRQISFGLKSAEVHAREVHETDEGSQFILGAGIDETHMVLPVPGLHNVRNALAAAAATSAIGLTVEEIAAGLASYKGVKGRLERKTAANGAVLIDDTYNANPDSMRAAIDVLTGMSAASGKPSILVLGDMGELGGDNIVDRHTEVGQYAKDKGVQQLFTLGTAMVNAANTFGSAHYASLEDLLAALNKAVTPERIVLVKGSRFMQMERVVKALQGENNNKKDA
ncbi:UDP-N-acetylmuramoyl-tripeptide--D-alanyl-D-alanine ligase [Silvimonas amylolytica]|uniref:UDP-N-acetylmuramoyl-tripeptide--D-alanyl-D-alanine ligase n=1 Tax=Silvimonas amylolytica TaxID=449663 RepID=A0ABQ2PKY1_9NEIS|nr:UDP-N-acetylmuramoyl-tripeptide--D-alanyl-D-alanine ligase [Silvimonas amylolytica]GGP25657.1 UDP-N-acetylmuramoyl-tripeptide--D-alanyl-D-alanine ligase [Silvimonas amylolytica]